MSLDFLTFGVFLMMVGVAFVAPPYSTVLAVVVLWWMLRRPKSYRVSKSELPDVKVRW